MNFPLMFECGSLVVVEDHLPYLTGMIMIVLELVSGSMGTQYVICKDQETGQRLTFRPDEVKPYV